MVYEGATYDGATHKQQMGDPDKGRQPGRLVAPISIGDAIVDDSLDTLRVDGVILLEAFQSESKTGWVFASLRAKTVILSESGVSSSLRPIDCIIGASLAGDDD